MTLGRLVLVLRARWRLQLLVAMGVLAATAVFTTLAPRRYVADAAVVLDVKSPDPIVGTVLPGLVQSGYMATQADVLRSDRVARRALAHLGEPQRDGLRAQWSRRKADGTDFETWAAAWLLDTLDVRPGRDSNVIALTSSAGDARLAASAVNAVVQAYIDVTLELKVEPARQYSGFFDQQAKAQREALEAAQERLSNYQRGSGITANDERLDAETARLGDLSAQVVALQGAAAETSSRARQAQDSAGRMQEVLQSGVVSSLKTELARQESRLEELLARLGERHPQVQEQRATVEQLRLRQDHETRQLVGSIDVAANVNRQRLADAQAALEAQRARVVRLREQRDRLAVLGRDVENAQHAFDAVWLRKSQTRSESELTQTNVAVLKVAQPPARAALPRTALNLMLGATVGLLAGVAAALLGEGLQPVVRDHEDLAALDLPLLEALPPLPGARRPGPWRAWPAWHARWLPGSRRAARQAFPFSA